jgi:enterochelin esterase-like enzyme
MRTVWLVCVLCGSVVYAQTELRVGEDVEGDIVPGNSQAYTIDLASGDYVSGTLDVHGMAVSIRVLQPDGARLRVFSGPAEGKRPFAFIAEAEGTYRLELTTPPAEAGDAGSQHPTLARYGLSLTQNVSLDERLKPNTTTRPLSSPTIEALRLQLTRGARSTDNFWRMVADRGTPLVESIPDDPRHVLVTFLYRDLPSTRNVAVTGTFLRQGMAQSMARLGDSDVWYLTEPLLAGARFVYLLSPNSPLLFEGPRAAEQIATLQADPLNRSRFACGPEASRFECQSMVELPGAVPQPLIIPQEGTPKGTVEKFRLRSELLSNDRTLSVYTPPGYRSGSKPYPLIVLFDEGSYLTLVPTPVILDNLISASTIPPSIAILVGNTNRDKELPPNAKFANFLANELIPWAHTHWNVTTDPEQTVIGGSSYGGLAAAYAGLRHPEVFGNILCQSASFMWSPDGADGWDGEEAPETGWLVKEYIKSPKLPLRFYIDAGLFEVNTFGTGSSLLDTSRHMRDVLLAKGYPVRYQEFVGGHDYLGWRGTLADGLVALIGTK